jgi:hypothetical protein
MYNFNYESIIFKTKVLLLQPHVTLADLWLSYLDPIVLLIIIIIIFIANKTLVCKAIKYNTTLQNIYT